MLDATNELQRLLSLRLNTNNNDVSDGVGDEIPEDLHIQKPNAKPVTASLKDIIAAGTTSNNNGILTRGVNFLTIDGANVTAYVDSSNAVDIQVVGEDINTDAIINEVQGYTVDYSDNTSVGAGNGDDIGVNGEIDEWVMQGGTGDCWLITGILAMSYTEGGREVLKSCITVNPDNSVTVNFKGLGVSYTVTADEIRKHDTDRNLNDAYSNGDNDMLALELAAEKLKKDILSGKVKVPNSKYRPSDRKDVLKGGYPEEMIYYMTGVQSNTKFSNNLASGLNSSVVKDFLQNAYENGNTTITIGIYGGSYGKTHTAKCIDGKTFSLYLPQNQGHALVVKNISKREVKLPNPMNPSETISRTQELVTIVNPWDSKEEYTMTWDEFAKLGIGMLSSADLSDFAPATGEDVVPGDDVVPTDDGVPGDDVTPSDDVVPEDDVTPNDDVVPEDDVTPADDVTPDDNNVIDSDYKTIVKDMNQYLKDSKSFANLSEDESVKIAKLSILLRSESESEKFNAILSSAEASLNKIGNALTANDVCLSKASDSFSRLNELAEKYPDNQEIKTASLVAKLTLAELNKNKVKIKQNYQNSENLLKEMKSFVKIKENVIKNFDNISKFIKKENNFAFDTFDKK